MSNVSFFFAGGGTGGHIYPAMAIAEQIVQDYVDTNGIFEAAGLGPA